MASMSVTAARCCWFWLVFWLGIGEAHLVLVDALPAEVLPPVIMDAGRAGRSAWPLSVVLDGAAVSP